MLTVFLAALKNWFYSLLLRLGQGEAEADTLGGPNLGDSRPMF